MQHLKIGRQFRSALVNDLSISEDGNSIDFSFSSEEPVERWFGEEVLSHEPGAMNLVRIDAGATPFLWNHDPNQPLGMVKSGSVVSKIGRGTATYFTTPFAQEKKQQYKEGLRNISFLYQIDKIKKTREATEDRPPQYTATEYTVYEISQVSVPADFTVGIGRSNAIDETVDVPVDEDEIVSDIEPVLELKTIEAPASKEKRMDPKEIEKLQADARTQERERTAAITGLCEKFKLPDMARDLINGGKTIEEAREAVLSKITTRQESVTETSGDIGLTEKEIRAFSFIRAINALANPGDRRAQEAAKFEREVSEAGAKARGKAAQGIYIPNEILRAQRDLTKGTASAGGNTVATNLLAGSFIEMLRKKSALDRAGATMLSGLVGDIAIPKQTGGATAYWVAESGAPTESQQAFGQVAMAPKTLGAFTDISRKLLIQSSIDIESLVQADLAKVIALAIDLAGLYGAGSSNQPQGVVNVSGIKTEDITDNAPTFAQLVEMESKIAAADADAETMSYIVNATMRGYLKSNLKFSAAGSATLWEPGNQVNGYNAVVSNQLTDGDVFFGNWADLLIGMWSGLDVTVDPYTQATSGTVRVIALQDVDCAVRHAESFCLGQ